MLFLSHALVPACLCRAARRHHNAVLLVGGRRLGGWPAVRLRHCVSILVTHAPHCNALSTSKARGLANANPRLPRRIFTHRLLFRSSYLRLNNVFVITRDHCQAFIVIPVSHVWCLPPSCRLVMKWIQWRRLKPTVEVTVTLVGAYLSFFVTNAYLQSSGACLR